LWELGVILEVPLDLAVSLLLPLLSFLLVHSLSHQVPAGTTAFYGSSLITHFNVNLSNFLTPEEIQSTLNLPCPYTKAMDDEDAREETRWSLVYFNQGLTRRKEEWTLPHTQSMVTRLGQGLSVLERFSYYWGTPEGRK
jgi:hypothetical protein